MCICQSLKVASNCDNGSNVKEKTSSPILVTPLTLTSKEDTMISLNQQKLQIDSI